MFFSKSSKGFTLVELLIVIAIIGILTAILTANFTQAKSKARDAKRVSDIAQLQLALQLFFDRCNVYPAVSATNGMPDLDSSCTSGTATIKLSDFIATIPSAPITGDYSYGIYRTTPSDPPTDYILRAKLENNNAVLTDDVDTDTYGVTCADAGNPPSLQYCLLPR